MAVTATLTVSFDAQSTTGIGDGFLKLELDSSRDGNLNGNNTSFYPNSNAYILLFASSGLSITGPKTTKGSINSAGSGNLTVTEEVITLSGSDTATLQYPVTGNFSASSSGTLYDETGVARSYSISRVDDVTLQLSSGGNPKPAYGILVASYKTSFTIWRLSGVPDRAMVLAIGT